MRRGFKSEAERISVDTRGQMGLKVTDPLDATDLAVHLGIEVRDGSTLVGRDRLEEIESIQPGAFSACTFEIKHGRRVIVYSPLASDARRQSDIAHEVAHQMLHHEVKQVERVGGFSFFACDPDEEQEANWLAGCLLLPRPLLIAAVRRKLSAEDIAHLYGVSSQMANYRLRATGVVRQSGR